jgi:hypothetical protein
MIATNPAKFTTKAYRANDNHRGSSGISVVNPAPFTRNPKEPDKEGRKYGTLCDIMK